MARKGNWIVIEGIDGSGKSTLAKALAQAYQEIGAELIKQTFEPTGERFGKLFQTRMRLHLKGECDFPFTEQLQVLTRDRFNHCALINGWLGDGAIVIQDRFWPSTIAYQGQSLDVVSLLNMHQWLFTPGPDHMFWLDTPLDVAKSRLSHRGDNDEFEKMLEGAQEIYTWLYEQRTLIRIDGTLSTDQQVAQVLKCCLAQGW